MPAIGIGLQNDDDFYKMFLLEICKTDCAHDFHGNRVDDLDIRAIVKKYLDYINITAVFFKSLVLQGGATGGVIISDVESSYATYCSTFYSMSTIRDNLDNTLNLTNSTTVTDFNEETDIYECKSMRVIWADKLNPNTTIQYENINKKILKYFGVKDDGELHLIIDSNAGKLTGPRGKARIFMAPDYNKVKVNINALNIADSASTRVDATNITHNYFPFTYGLNTTHNSPTKGIILIQTEATYATTNIGIYELNNWCLAETEMNKSSVPPHPTYFIYAYYTNAIATAATALVANFWLNELPFYDASFPNEEACYHISLKVGITSIKGNYKTLVSPEWESSFIQKGNKNINTTQGAGINTLSEFIEQIDKDGTIKIKPGSKEFDLSPILNGFMGWLKTNISSNFKRILVSFIFDYKRSGDHEQVLSCKLMNKQGEGGDITYVLSTGDQLCALWARCQGVSCIWHHDDKMDMYSFSKDVYSKIRQKQLDTVTNAHTLYTLQLTGLKTQTANVTEIIKLHKFRDKSDYAIYAMLESVTIYDKYLDKLLESISNKNDDSLKKYYTDLISDCNGIMNEIESNQKAFEDVDVDKNDPPNQANLAILKDLLENKWKVPRDEYSSFIGGIIACTRDIDEWKAVIDPINKIDIFGFTLLRHIDLSQKYGMLRTVHTAYNQKIFDSWNYGRDKEWTREPDKGQKPNTRPYEKFDSLDGFFNSVGATPTMKEEWPKYYGSTKKNYDDFTNKFLRTGFKKETLINANGSELLTAIFDCTDKIYEMNSLFVKDIVKKEKPTWYERENCHNTGGRYFGISNIADWLEDINAPDNVNLTGRFKNSRENNEWHEGMSPIALVALFHPENLEPKKFYAKYKTGAAELPLSRWLIMDIKHSIMGTAALPPSSSPLFHAGGGYDDDVLTHVSASKFIDYIETTMSIESDLDLKCVGNDVTKYDFGEYIKQSVKNLYLKYNQSDFNILSVYRLLQKLCKDTKINVPIIYRYIFVVYDLIYPDVVASVPFNPTSDIAFNAEWEKWRLDNDEKLKKEADVNKVKLDKYIPDKVEGFIEYITNAIEIDPDLSREVILSKKAYRSASINTVNKLELSIKSLIDEKKKYDDILNNGLQSTDSCPGIRVPVPDLPAALPRGDMMTRRQNRTQGLFGQAMIEPNTITEEVEEQPTQGVNKKVKLTEYVYRGESPKGPELRTVARVSHYPTTSQTRGIAKMPQTQEKVALVPHYPTSQTRGIAKRSRTREKVALVPSTHAHPLLNLMEPHKRSRSPTSSPYSNRSTSSNRSSDTAIGLKRVRSRDSQDSQHSKNDSLSSSSPGSLWDTDTDFSERLSGTGGGGKRKTYRKEKINRSRKRKINNTNKMGNQRRIDRKHTRRINRKHTRRINRKQTRKHKNRRYSS